MNSFTRTSYFNIFISALFIMSVLFPSTSEAHVSIPTAPTTACNSLDSLDLNIHAGNQIDSRLVGKATSTDWKLFTTRGTGTGTTYVRNSSIWTNSGSTSLDWTGISPYNTVGGYHTPGTLISPRHVLMASHYAAPDGAKMIFVDNSNNVYERTLIAVQDVGIHDVRIGLLDSDLPDSITYYAIIDQAVLANSLKKYTRTTIDTPIISFDQDKNALVRSLRAVNSDTAGIGNGTYTSFASGGLNTQNSGDRTVFSENLIGGDSGNPNFLIVDGQPILLGTHYSSIDFSNPGFDIAAVNAVMTSLGGGYQLTEYTPGTCFINNSPLNNQPAFTQASSKSFSLNQFNLSTTTVVRTYAADDADISQTLTFSLEGLRSNSTSTSLSATDYFSINSSTGELRQIQSINKNIYGNSFELSVKVTDNATNVGSSTITNLIGVFHIDGSIIIDLDENFISTSTEESGVRGLTPGSDGSVYLGNNSNASFRGKSGLTLGNVIKMRSDGSIDDAYIANQGIGASTTQSTSVLILNTFEDASNRLIVSGAFETFNNATSSRIARLNSDGSLDTAFASNTGSGLSAGSIYKSLTFGDKIMSIGTFSGATFNGTVVRRLLLLNDDGTLDTGFVSNVGTAMASFNPSFYSFIKYSDTQALVGGTFTSFNGTSAGRLVRLNIDGTLDTQFNTNIGTGFNGTVNALERLSNGKIVVGGGFTQLNSVSVPSIVVLNSDGTLDSSFTSNIGTGPNSGAGLNISVQTDGKIVIAGSFTSFNGVGTPSKIVRLNSDGTIDTAFLDGLGLGYTGATVNFSSLKRFSDNKLLIYGNYNYYNNQLLYGPHILRTSTPPIITTFGLDSSTDSGQHQDDYITNNATVSFNGSGTPSAILYLKEGSSILGTSTVDTGGSWSLNINLSEGTKTLKFAQELSVLDTATSADSQEFDIVVDRTAPEINGSSLSLADNVILHFTEDFATTSATSTSDWVVTQNGSQIGVSSLQMTGSNVYLKLNTALTSSTTVRVSYSGTGMIDVAGNQMQVFSNQTIENITPVVVTESQSSVPQRSTSSGSTGGGGGGGGAVIVRSNTNNSTNQNNQNKEIETKEKGIFSQVSGAKLNVLVNKNISQGDKEDAKKAITSLGLKISNDNQIQINSVVLNTNRSVGTKGEDVRQLQKLLNSLGYSVSKVGIGSKGKETTVFGVKTQYALSNFQKANGIKPATGFFGPVTRAKIVSLLK